MSRPYNLVQDNNETKRLKQKVPINFKKKDSRQKLPACIYRQNWLYAVILLQRI